MKTADPKDFDKRTVRRNIQQGLIKDEDYQKFLKSLPDEKDNLELVSLEEEDQKKDSTA